MWGMCHEINGDQIKCILFCWCCVTYICTTSQMNPLNTCHTLYTIYSPLNRLDGDMIQVILSSDRSGLCGYEVKSGVCGGLLWFCVLGSGVTCAKKHLLEEVLFPERPRPEHHEDYILHPPTPPHPALGLWLKTQHANPACPNRLGDWCSNNDSSFVLPLVLCMVPPYAVQVLQFKLVPPSPPTHTPPPPPLSLALKFFPSLSAG